MSRLAHLLRAVNTRRLLIGALKLKRNMRYHVTVPLKLKTAARTHGRYGVFGAQVLYRAHRSWCVGILLLYLIGSAPPGPKLPNNVCARDSIGVAL